MPLQHILVEHGAFEAVYRSYPPDTEPDCYHEHPGHEIYYQQSGARYLCTEQGTFFLGQGSLALVGRGCVHKTIPADHEPARALVLHFTGAYLASLQRALPGAPFAALFGPPGSGPVVLLSEQSGFLPDLLEQLRLLQDGADANAAARSKLLLAISLLQMQTLPRARPERHGPAGTLVQRAKSYIAARYRDPIDLAGVAAWLGVSRSYLSRTFGRVAGISLTQYINSVRVQAAQALLTGPHGAELDIPQVAAQCGFGSAAHFRRVFKEMVGTTPAHFRGAARQPARHTGQ